MVAQIKVHLDLLLVQRKMTLTELSGIVGVTLANLSILKRDKAKAIRFSTLVAICEALQCQPGDLLRLESESGLESGKDSQTAQELDESVPGN